MNDNYNYQILLQVQNKHTIIHIIIDKMKCKINLYIIDKISFMISYHMKYVTVCLSRKIRITISLTKQIYVKFIINLYLLKYLINFIKLYNYIIEKVINLNLLWIFSVFREIINFNICQ